jgi:hypothetical protein
MFNPRHFPQAVGSRQHIGSRAHQCVDSFPQIQRDDLIKGCTPPHPAPEGDANPEKPLPWIISRMLAHLHPIPGSLSQGTKETIHHAVTNVWTCILTGAEQSEMSFSFSPLGQSRIHFEPLQQISHSSTVLTHFHVPVERASDMIPTSSWYFLAPGCRGNRVFAISASIS